MPLSTCSLEVNTTLPLVCISSLLSFLCGVGIGANDLSANFAMVVGSGSLNMKQAIIYCTVFELLGAAFMGGHVSSTIRNGIVDSALFNQNKDVVVIGMACASFAAAMWLYLSTVFGLPVSITHTVVGSILGFAIFASGGFQYVKSSGLVVIVISWVAAPVAACAVTAVIFYYMRRDIFKVKGRSFELASAVLPYCLAASLLVDFFFILIEKPPIMTQTFARVVPLWLQYVLLLLMIAATTWGARRWMVPQVAAAAMAASSFVWESGAVRTEAVEDSEGDEEGRHPSSSGAAGSLRRRPSRGGVAEATKNLSFFKSRGQMETSSTTSSSASSLVALEEAALPPSSQAEGEEASIDVPLGATGSSQISASRPPTPSSLAQGGYQAAAPLRAAASVVMSSMQASDSSFVGKGSTVRLAAVPSRTPSPMPRSSSSHTGPMRDYLPGPNTARTALDEATSELFHHDHHARDGRPLPHGAAEAVPLIPSSGVFVASHSMPSYGAVYTGETTLIPAPASPTSIHSDDEFGEEDWAMDHPMPPIHFGGILIKPFNPRAEYLFTGLQVVAGSMSSFVHGAVAGANATATFVILYEAFTNHELGENNLSSQWSVLPAMLGIAVGMFGLGASLMKTVGMELVTVTPARGWCIQVGGTLVTMVLTGLGIPVSLSQSQVGAAIGCGVLDAKLGGVSWGIVTKVVTGWVITLFISAVTTGVSMLILAFFLC